MSTSGTTRHRAQSRPSWDAFSGPVIDASTGLDLSLLDNQRVALVGEPARVVRAVSAAARHARTLKVFQTDGVWVLPHLGALADEAFALLLPVQLRRRLTEVVASGYLRHEIPDAWMRRQLTPTQAPTRDTVMRSSRYYQALRLPNVDLIGWPIAGMVAPGIRTADGIEHHVDVILVA